MMGDRRTFRYRMGESRIFDSPESVPNGEGWVDSPAKVLPAPEREPPEMIPAPLAPLAPPELPATGEAPGRPGRKPRK